MAMLDVHTALFGLLVLLFISLIVRSFRQRVRNLPPGPTAWPLIGCMPQLLLMCVKTRNVNQISMQLCDKYGSVCNIALPFGMNVVLVSGYKAVNEAFTSPKIDQRLPSAFVHHPVDVLNGAGIMLSAGEKWKEHRKFSLSVFRSFGVGKRSFEDQIATESEYLMKEISSKEGKPFDPTHLLCNAVSNIICSVVFGKRFEYDDPEYKYFLHSLKTIVSDIGFNLLYITMPRFVYYISLVPFVPNASMNAFISIRRKMQDIVNEHRDALDTENMGDFIDVYLNDMQMKKDQGIHTTFSDVELIANVHDFFGAGTEPTSTTLRWALLYMLKYPEIQTRVQEELDSVVGRDRLPKLSDKPDLPYTVAVINEIQRFAGIVFLSPPRYTSNDVFDFQGLYTIPKGSYVQPCLHSASRDDTIWEDANEFKPERFLDEKGQVMKIPENMVFGAGKRVCLGEQLAHMELFIFYTHLMHRYTFKKPEGMESVNIQPTLTAILTPCPYDIRAIERT